jgi:predicted NAD/FAD-binding protein
MPVWIDYKVFARNYLEQIHFKNDAVASHVFHLFTHIYSSKGMKITNRVAKALYIFKKFRTLQTLVSYKQLFIKKGCILDL